MTISFEVNVFIRPDGVADVRLADEDQLIARSYDGQESAIKLIKDFMLKSVKNEVKASQHGWIVLVPVYNEETQSVK